MLLFIAQLEDAEKERFALKRSLLATGNFDHEKMFPEYFTKTVESDDAAEEAETAGDHVNYDYSGVKWQTPAENKDQYEQLLNHMLRQGGDGTMTGEQVVVTETEWV